jgi:hypothetical protein
MKLEAVVRPAYRQVGSPAKWRVADLRLGPLGYLLIIKLQCEAAVRFELTNKGFADLRLGPLGNAAQKKNPDKVGI